jgi:hypothetical protein
MLNIERIIFMWIAKGDTESGDELQVLIFELKPSREEVEKIYRRLYPIEYEEVGFVHFDISEPLYIKDIKEWY